MAANKRKILEAARKHAQKGSKDRALKEYEKLLKLDPKDAKLRLEIGDAYRRWGQLEQAIGTYTKVADQYMKEGFDARAVAVYKQILNLDAEHWPSYEPLSELYQRMGLASEAIQALQAAADGHHKAGRRRDALGLLRKMAAIDPTNTTSRLKVADLLRQEKLTDEAIDEYEGVADELDRQGETEQATAALERVLELDPKRHGALKRLARSLMGAGQAPRAEPFAKRLLDAEPDEAENYELLAEIYRVQSRVDELGDVYRRMAELYRRRGDEDRAREITQRFVPPAALATGDADLDDGGLLDETDSLQGDLSSFLDDDFGSDELLDEDLLEPSAPDAIQPPAPVSTAEATVLQAPPEDEATRPDELAPEGDAEQLFAEACVYLRYGKRAQAVRNLEAILAENAQHRPALEKLGEAFAEAGDNGQAVEVWMRAAHVAHAEGDEPGLDVLRDRIAALDPEAVATLQPSPDEPAPIAEDDDFLEVEEPMAAPEAEPQVAAAAPEEPDDDFGIDVSDLPVGEPSDSEEAPLESHVEIDVDVDLEVGEEPLESPPAMEGPAAETAEAAPEDDDTAAAEAKVLEDLEEAEFYRQQGMLDEAERTYRQILQRAPGHPQVLLKLGELGAEREEQAEATPSSAPPAAEVEEPTVDAEVPTDLGDWTDEFSDALADEEAAPSPGEEPARSEPEPEEVEVPPTEALIASEETVPDLDLSEPEAEGDESYDLAAELEDAFDSKSATATAAASADSFSSIFSEFKKGVSRTLSDSDHEAHYDLGIAYREMGLYDDAIGEFRIALESPTRRLACLHMLGQCAIDAGRADQATAHLEEALASGVSGEQQLALRFDLGRAFEALGDIDAARSAWEAVVEVDPGFQDVEQHLANLGGEKPAEAASEDEGFESFDDVIGDDGADPASSAPLESFDDLHDDEPEPAVVAEIEEPPAAEPEADESPKPRRKRKKISFV